MTSLDPPDAFPFHTSELDSVVEAVDRIVTGKTGKHLNTLQVTILRGAWMGHTYDSIAQTTRWSEAHVKAIGADLWELMSEVLAEPINRKNFRATAERRREHLGLASPPDSLPVAVFSRETPLALPLAEFLGGPIDLASPLYCDRPPVESRCYTAIEQPGVLLRICAPHQMGKTSLLYRVLTHGEKLRYKTIRLNLQLVDPDIMQNLDRFLRWFCGRVTQKLSLPSKLADYWDEVFGSKTSCKDYFENYLLPQCPSPLVLALDDVDTLFAYPDTADGFFAVLRTWYEEAKHNELWQILRLILVHSTDTHGHLCVNQSPFHVGACVELPEFNAEQVQTLAHWHGLVWSSAEVDQLMRQVGGHPYKVRLALYHIAQSGIALNDFLAINLADINSFSAHLPR